MKRKAILAFSLVIAASGGTFGCAVADGAADGDDAGLDGDDDADDDEGVADDDAADDDTSDDDATTDDDAADDDAADDDASSDDDAADDDVADDDASDDDAADDDVDAGDDDAADDDAGAADDDVDAGDPVEDDDVADDDAGADDDEGDAGDDDTGEGGTTKSGYVSIGQSVLSVAGTSIVTGYGSAGFNVTETTSVGEVPTPNCEVTTAGDCTLISCGPAEDGNTPGESTTTAVSAGDVTVDGAGEAIVLTPNEEATYSTYTGMTMLWEGGEALSASAPGTDDVPAFEIELTAPSVVTLTEPVVDLLTPISASRAEPFEVQWADGEEGTVQVSLIDTTEGAEITHSISCTVPASSGGVTISEELLADFGDSGAFAVGIMATGSATVEDWNISFSANQSLATGQVEFTE